MFHHVWLLFGFFFLILSPSFRSGLQIVNRLLSDFNFRFIKQKVVSAVKNKEQNGSVLVPRRNQKRDLTPWLAAGKGDQETLTSQWQKLVWAFISMTEFCRAIIYSDWLGLEFLSSSQPVIRPQKRTKWRKEICVSNCAHLCRFSLIKVDYKNAVRQHIFVQTNP